VIGNDIEKERLSDHSQVTEPIYKCVEEVSEPDESRGLKMRERRESSEGSNTTKSYQEEQEFEESETGYSHDSTLGYYDGPHRGGYYDLDEGDEKTYMALMQTSTFNPRLPQNQKAGKLTHLMGWLKQISDQQPTAMFQDPGRLPMDRTGLGFSHKTSKNKKQKKVGDHVSFVSGGTLFPDNRTELTRDWKEVTALPKRKQFTSQDEVKRYIQNLMEKDWDTRKTPKATIAYIWNRNYNPSPIIEMYVEGKGPRRVLIDSGAGPSLISKSWFRKASKNWSEDEKQARYAGPAWELAGITGPDLPTLGKYKMMFQVNDSSFPAMVAVSDDPARELDYRLKNIDAILGMNFILKHKVILDFDKKVIKIGKQTIPYVNEGVDSDDSFTIGAIPINNRAPTVISQKVEPSQDFHCEKFELRSPICLKPSSSSWYMVYGNKIAVEDMVIPNQIVAPGIVLLKTVWNEGQKRVWIGLRNEMNQECRIQKGAKIWLQVRKRKPHEGRSWIGAMIADPEIDRESEEYIQEWTKIRDAVVEKAEILSDESKGRLRNIFDEYKDIMRLKHEPPGEVKTYEVEVELTKYEPVHIRPYSLSDIVQKEIDRQLGVMLKHDVIRPSISEWSFPIVAVKKKLLDLQNDQVQDIRMCIDFRPLNKVTKPMSWPIPTVDATLQQLGGSKFFTTLDVLSGFWNLPIKEQHRKYLAFATKLAHYEFCRMPFGWINSPFHFQRYMQTRIADRNKDCCQVYIDDIIINSDTEEEHFEHIKKVLQVLREEGVYLKMMKVHAFQPQIEYLGHIISREGIRKDPKKLATIANAKVPTNKKQVRSFLGKINYLGKFIANLAEMSGPLAKLTSARDDVPFVWGPEQQVAFERLKKAVLEDVMLAFPDTSKPYNVTTDASDYAVSGVISQTDDATKLERPIMFISKSLNDTQRRYTVTEKELYAIIHALDKFRPYIYGRKFTVYTDHRALIWLCGKRNPMSRLGRWSVAIAEYSQGIEFIAGKQNRVADALSRAPFVDEPPMEVIEDYQGNNVLPENVKQQIASIVGVTPEELKQNEAEQWERMQDMPAATKGLKWDRGKMMKTLASFI